MLKYHNFDDSSKPIELYYNGKMLDIDDSTGREIIDKMRNSYFHLWDLISMTAFDAIKKRLLKNKIKATIVDIYGKLVNKYCSKKDVSIFTEALSVDGCVIKQMEEFATYVFGEDDTRKDYFLKESIRIISNAIFSLSLLKE